MRLVAAIRRTDFQPAETIMTGTELHTAFRLALIAKNHGADFLDNEESFARMIGPGAFALYHADTINHVRRLIEAFDYRPPRNVGIFANLERTFPTTILSAKFSAASAVSSFS